MTRSFLVTALVAVLVTALGATAATPAQASCTITPPMAGIYQPPGTLYRNVALGFTASGTPSKISSTCTTGSKPGTKIVKWEWDWNGDGGTDETTTNHGISSSRPHTYTTTGAGFKAGMRVTDDQGRTSAWNFTLFSIVNKPPTAALSVPATGIKNQAVTLDGSGSSDQAGDPTPHVKAYHWDINGNARTTTGPTTSETWSLNGTKTIRLRVEDKDGGFSDWVQRTIKIESAPPVIASVSISNSAPLSNTSVSFSASASSPAGLGLTYHWSFGDGHASGSASTSHTYGAPGAKTVTLTVRDSEGGTDVETRTISVQNRAPVASFTCAPAAPFAGEQVTCTSTSTDPDDGVASQGWDLHADGSYDGGYDTSFVFTQGEPGTVPLRFTARDRSGVATDVQQQLTFSERVLVPSFTFGPQAPKPGEEITFDAGASRDPGGPVARYEWDFDNDGTFEVDRGTSSSATHTFTTAGTHQVGLRITSASGATKRLFKEITVTAPPVDPPKPPDGDDGDGDGRGDGQDGTGGGTGGGGTGTGTTTGAGTGGLTPVGVAGSPTPAAAAPRGTAAVKAAVKPSKRAGACSKLKGKKRSSCLARTCKGKKGASRKDCARKATAKAGKRR